METNLFTRSRARARGKVLWAGLLRVSGVLNLAKRWVERRGVVVLTFHRVLEGQELRQTASLPGMVVKGQTFDEFLKYVSERCESADLVKPPDWAPNARLKLAITFDDGWSDNKRVAFPIARKHRVPMTIFIVPEKMGSALPFWPERAATILEHELAATDRTPAAKYIERTIETLKGLSLQERNQRVGALTTTHSAPEPMGDVDRTMTWLDVSELDSQGVRFGSHTSTHEILTILPLEQAAEEISGSRSRIEQALGKPCEMFSYPNGDSSPEVRDLVQRAGYRLAFLNQDPGVWTRDCDPYLIPRVNVCEYHLVDANGRFSPLIFDYAVIWNAAKGLIRQRWRKNLSKLRRKLESWIGARSHQQKQIS
jgi:peptidoglycan/xylan/chitin deacetylase (PgdA/CDA1 family)